MVCLTEYFYMMQQYSGHEMVSGAERFTLSSLLYSLHIGLSLQAACCSSWYLLVDRSLFIRSHIAGLVLTCWYG